VRHTIASVAAACVLWSSPSGAAELSESYPNAVDVSLQATWDRLCDAASDGDTINIDIAEGVYQEQLINACRAAVNVRIKGAGMGKTVFTGPIKTHVCGLDEAGQKVCYQSDRQFAPMLVCSRASTSMRPGPGGLALNSCADFRDAGPPGYFREICLALARKIGDFERWETSCEVSDLSLQDGPAPVPPYPAGTVRTSTSMIAGTWNTLRVFNVETTGFVDTQIRCTNCRDVEIHHVKVRCPTRERSAPPLLPYTGIDVNPGRQNQFPVGPDNVISGTNIHHAEIENCERGIFLVRQVDGTIAHNDVRDTLVGVSLQGSRNMILSHNRIVRSESQGLFVGAGIELRNAHQTAIVLNQFLDSTNAIRLLNSAPSFEGFPGPSSGNLFELNQRFGDGTFLLDEDSGDNFDLGLVIEPGGDPQGW
jgi:parallel beta-helix repeat protein